MSIITKNRDGKWKGRDDINLGIVPGAKYPIVLQIRTDVDSRKGARTTATAMQDNGRGGLVEHMLSFGGPGGDFFRLVRQDQSVTRGTEKSVTAAHAAALEKLPEIIGMVEAFYGAVVKVEDHRYDARLAPDPARVPCNMD